MDDFAVRVENVGKTFKLPHEKNTSVKSAFINLFRSHKKGYEVQHALEDISIEVKKGEFFGIVGRNGSGKSTLLKLIAGIYTPTKGQVRVSGSLTPFIELGVGFNPELTGRENVYLNGALLGFGRKDMQKMYKDIVEFAEIDRFMDQKLKNYSSGMQVRLAFSIAIRAKSDILLIDEVLAVGDMPFQEKSYEVFRAIKKSGRTVIFVSHDLNSLREFCDRVAILDRSKLIEVGQARNMIVSYEALVADDKPTRELLPKRPGTGAYEIKKVEILNRNNMAANHLKEKEPFTIKISFKASQEVDSLVCGLAIEDSEGNYLLGPNTEESDFRLSPFKPGARHILRAQFTTNLLSPGNYKVTVGLFNQGSTKPYDFCPQAASFKVIGSPRHGKFNVTPKWAIDS